MLHFMENDDEQRLCSILLRAIPQKPSAGLNNFNSPPIMDLLWAQELKKRYDASGFLLDWMVAPPSLIIKAIEKGRNAGFLYSQEYLQEADLRNATNNFTNVSSNYIFGGRFFGPPKS